LCQISLTQLLALDLVVQDLDNNHQLRREQPEHNFFRWCNWAYIRAALNGQGGWTKILIIANPAISFCMNGALDIKTVTYISSGTLLLSTFLWTKMDSTCKDIDSRIFLNITFFTTYFTIVRHLLQIIVKEVNDAAYSDSEKFLVKCLMALPIVVLQIMMIVFNFRLIPTPVIEEEQVPERINNTKRRWY